MIIFMLVLIIHIFLLTVCKLSFAFKDQYINNYLQSWDAFFRNSASGGAGYQAPPSLGQPGRNEVLLSSVLPMLGSSAGIASGGMVNDKVIDDHLAVQAIIRSYQVT